MRSLATLCALLVGLVGCADKSTGPEPGSGDRKPTVIKEPAAGDVRPRLVLSADTITRLKKAASSETSEWMTLAKRCRVFMSGDKSAGYLGLQWAEAVLSLSLCWHATSDETFADQAVKYATALLDDRERVGDGRGGDEEVRRNSGYPIRAHGFGAAIAYDWLYNAKAMTPALRAKIAERLDAWLAWYGDKGYLNDSPFANYFWGYMSSLAMAALALDGETDAASAWMKKTTELIEGTVIPAFADKLRGGTWAEGWQYGPLVSVNLAMVLRSFETAKGISYRDRFPWFREIVRSHLHRVHPTRETAYSNGTHKTKPSVPNATPLRAVAFLLAESEPNVAANARFIERKLFPPARPRYPWFALLASLTGDDELDPIKADGGEPLSYHLAGPGLTFARSGWDRRAVWTSFQAGPKIAVDHQHNDQGHFELWRGGDALLVDGGDTAAFATINHNTLLIDDAGRVLSYPPNQGVWGRKSRTIGYSDDSRVVVAVGDLASAWDPKCAERGCDRRTVNKALRTFVFVRPNVLVIDDRIEVASDKDLVTWAAHMRAAPAISGLRAGVENGGSRADLTILAPAGVRLRAPKEPTSSETHVYRRNSPRGDVWRLEVPSKTGAKTRHFRVWISANNRGAPSKPAKATSANSMLGESSFGPVAIAFADGGTARGKAPSEGLVVAVGLEPGKRYGLSTTRSGGCSFEVSPKSTGTLTASEAGAVSTTLKACKAAPNAAQP